MGRDQQTSHSGCTKSGGISNYTLLQAPFVPKTWAPAAEQRRIDADVAGRLLTFGRHGQMWQRAVGRGAPHFSHPKTEPPKAGSPIVWPLLWADCRGSHIADSTIAQRRIVPQFV